MVGFMPLSESIMLLLWVLVVMIIVIKDKMWQKLPTKSTR
jgi:hypothetical protein